MKKIVEFLRSLKEDFKANRRGEKRVAPRGVRGRVYAPKQPAPRAEPLASKARHEAVLHITVTRADGTVERRTVPAQVTRNG